MSRPDLRAAKVDMSVVQRLVRAGRWKRLWDGMFLCGDHVVGPLERAHAAIKHGTDKRAGASSQQRPLLSGLAGCEALNLRWVPAHQRTQLLVGPEVRRKSNDLVLVRRTHDLADIEPWNWAGVAVADPTRLVVDGARECTSLRDVRGLALGAIADGWTGPSALLQLLDAGAKAGTAWLRRVAGDALLGAASPPEAELADGLRAAGIPFALNVEVWLDGVLVAVLDAYLIGTGVGIELDSVERHGSSLLLEETFRRDCRVQSAGLRLLHVTPASYRADPDAVHARALQLVAEQVANGWRPPPGLVLRPRRRPT